MASDTTNQVFGLVRSGPLVFPEIAADNLLGEERNYPDWFLGRRSLVLTVWTQEMQPEADTWLASLEQFESVGLDVIEHLVVARQHRLIKGIVDGWMCDAIPAEADRRRTVTLFTSLREHAGDIEAPNTESIDVLLVDDQACIVERWRGPATSVSVEAVIRWAMGNNALS